MKVYHMKDSIIRMRLMVILVLFVCAFAVWFLPYAHSTFSIFESKASPYLQVHFLDVGQGDAALIETPSGVQVLIDGGKDATVLRRLSSEMSFFDRTIDVVIGTHPDKDHIGGLIDVLKRYKVLKILTTENKGDTGTAELYNKLKSKEGAEVLIARRGQEIHLDASTTLRILFPDSDPTNMESNTSSIVFQLLYGSSTFMFTGDSPKSIEEYLVLVEGESLKSDVLKLGHHGSRTSTSELYLDEVQPKFAIVSAGKDNTYGHPHVEVTDLLFNARVQILETVKEGTITMLSDGKKVWQK
jgi:competence protein ComEC